MENNIRLSRSIERQWLKKHGKAHYITFSTDDRLALKRMFKDIDTYDKGHITVKEFYEPLLGLGLIQNYQQFSRLIFNAYGQEINEIRFHDFLKIL